MSRVIKEHTWKLQENHELEMKLAHSGGTKEVRIRIWSVKYGPFGITLHKHRVHGWTRRLLKSDDFTFEELVEREVTRGLKMVKDRIQAAEELEAMEVTVK